MPEKILRLGYTEATLLFIHWSTKYNGMEEIPHIKSSCIQWLYTTSGYYDKTQQGNYFDVSHTNDPPAYTKYMDSLLTIINNCDRIEFNIHDINVNPTKIIEFNNYINKKDCFISQEIVFNFIKNKKILIISPFSHIIKYQLETGNCKKIYNNTPDVISINTYIPPYTFFNNGPHNNLLETCEDMYNDIVKNSNEYEPHNNLLETCEDMYNDIVKNSNEYESVIVSCGAYGCLLSQKLYETGKNICVVGGEIQTYFGILNGRRKTYNKKHNIKIENERYWITNIPDKYKPLDYMKIENGCYW